LSGIDMTARDFTETYGLRWYDIDEARHVRSSALVEFASYSRVSVLTAAGLGSDWGPRCGVTMGAVREEVDYRSKPRYSDMVTVGTRLSGLSPDASGWRFDHELRRSDGWLCALIRCSGAWSDLETGHLVAPPPEVAAALRAVTRTDDFDPGLPSTLRP
jgi:acyl-CoA thioesterase FadM